jgi:DNA-binding NarL/FixJ family response regulator
MVARRARPGAIVDIRMPPTHTGEGLVATEQIRADHAQVDVLVLSQYVELAYAMRLIKEHPGASATCSSSASSTSRSSSTPYAESTTGRPWSTPQSSPDSSAGTADRTR